MSATYINGFGGDVTIGSFTFSVVEWSLKVDNGLIDVTNTGSNNYGQYIAGVNNGSLSIKAFWNTTSSFTGAAGILPGIGATFTGKVGATGGTVVCSIQIMNVSLTVSPTAGVQYDIEAKTTSAPTYPT